MEGLELLKEDTWQLFGSKHWFFAINYTTIRNTWIALFILILILIPIHIILKKKPGVAHFMVTSFADYFATLIKQSLGFFVFKHFAFIASLFTFILLCNMTFIIPGLEEPTQDPNTTLALGIISFLYIQYYSIRTVGVWEYIKEYFEPFFPMLPLNIVGKLANILSISFRLFGNIFGGVIISKIYMAAIEGSWWKETVGIISGMNFLIKFYFGFFAGVLQAFVFTMLTITYLSIELQKKEHSASKPNKPIEPIESSPESHPHPTGEV